MRSNGGQLYQFLCTMHWLRYAITSFEPSIAPLQNFQESSCNQIGNRTKRFVAGNSIDRLGWTDKRIIAFEKCKRASTSRVTLVHCDKTKCLIVYTVAIGTHGFEVITHVSMFYLYLPHAGQTHEPVSFHSDRHFTTQFGCYLVRNYAQNIPASVKHSHWLAACSVALKVFTDHKNLILSSTLPLLCLTSAKCFRKS